MQNRVEVQIADSPVHLFMGAAVEIVLSTPQVRVQNRTQEQIVDSVPQVHGAQCMEALPPYTTGKVCRTVRHRSD